MQVYVLIENTFSSIAKPLPVSYGLHKLDIGGSSPKQDTKCAATRCHLHNRKTLRLFTQTDLFPLATCDMTGLDVTYVDQDLTGHTAKHIDGSIMTVILQTLCSYNRYTVYVLVLSEFLLKH